MSSTTSPITSEMVEQYHEEGYFILPEVLSPHQIEQINQECQRFIDSLHEEMDKKQTDVIGITHRNKRYFISGTYKHSQTMHDFIFSELMADICRATLGENARFFLDQFVVKSAEIGMKFSWHQDSGYIPFDHTPYLTCWTALDDMTEENGTVYVLPFSRVGVHTRVRHIREEVSNDMVGYFGDDPGVPVIVPAGSIAVFQSVTFHRSGTNTSAKPRRVILTQYTPEVINNPFTGAQHLAGIPFVQGGKVVNGDFPIATTL